MSKELEKAAKKYSGIMYDREDYEEKYFNGQGCDKYDAFLEGAKWQSERSYSEEDMSEAFVACWKANVPDGIECKLSFQEWFEQFKQEKK